MLFRSPGAGPVTASPSAGDTSTKPGLSTLAKVGIAAGGVVIVGGTIAAILSASGKK